MNIIFNIQGGLGKNIMGTAMCQVIKKKYPDSNLIVVSAYKDVFLNNPLVYRSYTHEEQKNLYSDFIEDCETMFMVSDPYTQNDFFNDNKHLYEIWCESYGLKYNGEQPIVHLSKAEKQYYDSIYKLDRPIFLLQSHGGSKDQGMMYNWSRDMPDVLIKKIIEKYKKSHVIVHVKNPEQPVYDDTLQALDSYRSIAYLISLSNKMLVIDSFCQHMAIAMKKQSVVLWCGTNPDVFGYEKHLNVKSNRHTKPLPKERQGYKQIELVERIENIPYNDLNEIYDFDETCKLLNKLK